MSPAENTSRLIPETRLITSQENELLIHLLENHERGQRVAAAPHYQFAQRCESHRHYKAAQHKSL